MRPEHATTSADDALAADAARLLAQGAMQTLATRPAFHAALGSGAWLAPMLAALARLPVRQRLDWACVHLLAADDAWDDAARQALAALPLPPGNLVWPRRAGIGRVDAARDYEQRLRAHFSLSAGALPVFDLVLLEAAAAGRIAGAAASAPQAADLARLVVAQPGAAPGLALALPVLEEARRIVLVGGQDTDATAAPPTPTASPAAPTGSPPSPPPMAALRPRGELQWLLPSTTRSSASATPPTVRDSRSGRDGS